MPRTAIKCAGIWWKRNKSSSSSSSSMSIHTSPPSLNQELVKLNLSKSILKCKARVAMFGSITLPILQTVQKHYTAAIDYPTYRLASRYQRYDNAVSSYVTKRIKKAKLQMTVHFLIRKTRAPSLNFLQRPSSCVLRTTFTRKQPCEFYPTTCRNC